MNIPRRAFLDKMVPAELAIRNAVVEIEKMGCDTRLTRAQVLLQEAKDLVSDVVDEATNLGRNGPVTLPTDAQRALTEMGRVVDGLTKTNKSLETMLSAEREASLARYDACYARDREIADLRAKLAEAERERDAAKRAVQDVAVTQREACASHLYEREQYGRRPHELAGIVRETPLVTGEAPKREWIWMLGHYGVQWYDPAGGVEKELARWDDEPEPTIGERVEIYCRAIQELAALRKREADKLSAIAADIAPLNPPAPDSTVRRDGMVCTCGESERRWHLRDCPMSSAGKAQRKEGEK